MINKVIFSCVTLMSLISWQSQGQAKKSAINYLGIRNPVSLNREAFHLVWSSHPDTSFYKQEYLTTGDAFPNYKSMITIDISITQSTIDQALATKIQELEQLKKNGYDVNFDIIKNPNTGEKIVDCLIGQTSKNDLESLIERDVYRFKAIKTKSGKHGLYLFASSTRRYGKDIKPFLINLKAQKHILINEIANMPLPDFSLP